MKEELVCVGGPCDGRKIAIDRQANSVRMSFARAIVPTAYGMAPDVSYVTYERYIWRTPDTVRSVLVPEGQPSEETLALLIDGYERAKVTPEMIRVGAHYLSRFNRHFDDEEDYVAELYREMTWASSAASKICTNRGTAKNVKPD